MTHPKITIVTPSFNQGQYLEDTILSILGQNYPNLEYFVYDAASTDNSVEIIKKYQENITYWVSEKDEGQADAINKGFLKSTGDILMWLNSDDVLMPNVLSYIAKLYMEKGDGIYFGNCIHFKEKKGTGLHAHGSNVHKNFNAIPLELVDSVIQPSSFWSRAVWLKNGTLDKRFHFGFDWEWFLRAKKNNIAFYAFNKPISLYRFHEAHKTGVGGEKRQEELYQIYSIYNPNYAKLYDLIRREKYNFNIMQKLIIKCSNVFFKSKNNRIYLLKNLKFRKYKGYTVEEIENIIGML